MTVTTSRDLITSLGAATAAAALAAASHVGLGDGSAADRAGVDAMRAGLDRLPARARVVVGEGEKDRAPMLYRGEELGRGERRLDLAVDPVEGTSLLAAGRPGALSVLGAAPAGSLFDPGPCFYLDKLVVGAPLAGKIELDTPMEQAVAVICRTYGIGPEEVGVVVLDRPRNRQRIDGLRRAGVEPVLITHGDVGPALSALLGEGGVQAVVGIGGAPEGVLTACAVRSTGGEIQARLAPQQPEEQSRVREQFGTRWEVMGTGDLVASGTAWFAATGITGDGLFPPAGDQTAPTLLLGTAIDPRWVEMGPP